MRKKSTWVLVLCLLAASASVFAKEVYNERKNLQLIKDEIAALTVLINHAKLNQDTSRRTQFQYDVLLDDLETIKKGIDHHLTKPLEVQAQASKLQLKQNYTIHNPVETK